MGGVFINYILYQAIKPTGRTPLPLRNEDWPGTIHHSTPSIDNDERYRKSIKSTHIGNGGQ